MSAFTSTDLTEQVADTVIADLERGLRFFEGIFRQKRFTDKDIINGVFLGAATRIAGKAAIRVVIDGKESGWHATRVRDDHYKFNIDVLAKVTAKKEEIESFINTFAGAVHNYLIRFDNLQPKIIGTNVQAYNAWADNYTKGYSEGGAYRVARIPYYITIMNPYMGHSVSQSSC